MYYQHTEQKRFTQARPSVIKSKEITDLYLLTINKVDKTKKDQHIIHKGSQINRQHVTESIGGLNKAHKIIRIKDKVDCMSGVFMGIAYREKKRESQRQARREARLRK